jgi:hypothetical protein
MTWAVVIPGHSAHMPLLLKKAICNCEMDAMGIANPCDLLGIANPSDLKTYCRMLSRHRKPSGRTGTRQ